MPNLEGRAILVTGAAGGQGVRSCAGCSTAAPACWRPTCPGRRWTRSPTSARTPSASWCAAADVTSEPEVAATCAAAVEAFGGLDGLYSNAGVYWHDHDAPADELALDVWERVLAINATRLLPLLQARPAEPASLGPGRGGQRLLDGRPCGRSRLPRVRRVEGRAARAHALDRAALRRRGRAGDRALSRLRGDAHGRLRARRSGDRRARARRPPPWAGSASPRRSPRSPRSCCPTRRRS